LGIWPFQTPLNSNYVPFRQFTTSKNSTDDSEKTLSHVDSQGKVQMVDVSHKKETIREAIAEGFVRLSPLAFQAVAENKMKKGDVLTVAQIAGIVGAKHTSALIPLCHPLLLSRIDVQLTLQPDESSIRIESTVKTSSTTGVEMEALTATAVAALTIYDMCKAVDKSIEIKQIRLVKKTGGKSDYKIDNN
jgi:molybdenum cofactor biosynthesis protein MoaC